MRAFLAALWPGMSCPGNLTIWVAPSKKSAHISLPDFAALTDDDLEDLHVDNRKGASIYVGHGLRTDGLGPHQLGRKSDIVAISSMVLDIDIWHPTAHVATNLPRTEEEAYQIIELAPPPSIIVHTGHGLQVWYLLTEPLFLTNISQQTQAQKAFKQFQAPFIERAAELGWHLDNTASIQHVWRIPGFVNPKSGAPVQTLHIDPDTRYTPAELGVMMKVSKAPAPTPLAHTGVSAEFLAALKNLNKSNQNKAMVEKILAGLSFADTERDSAMQRVCSTMAWLPEARELTADAIAEVLRPSLAVWVADKDNPKWRSLDEEMEKAVDKILRAQQDQHDHQAEQKEKLSGLAAALRVHKGEDDPADPPDARDAPNEIVLQHAIIQFRSSFYVWNFDSQSYSTPKTKDELLTYARDAWKSGPKMVLDYNDKGVTKQKTIPRVLREYATVAVEVIGLLYLPKSYYDLVGETFYESVAPPRKLEPLYDPTIAHWLELLGGPLIEKLLDWLAVSSQLRYQCCVLYLDGAPGAGKGLLGLGVAKTWHLGGPTPLESVLDSFNADMFRCPLLMLDEGISKHRGNISTQLRSLVGASSFTFSQKFLANRPVLGSVRLLIAANNDNVLAFGEENMSVDDLQAYVGRFLHIKVSSAAAEWLQENNEGNKITRGWVEDDLIARHCLWLAQNRVVTPGRRFIVEGVELDEMHRKLLMSGERPGLVYEWLARFCMNPGELDRVYTMKRERSRALIGNKKLLVNAQAVRDLWDTYMNKDSCPSTTKIGETLNTLSEGTTQLGPDGARIRYHQIRFDLVLGWATNNQIGDEDTMLENYEKETDETA